MVSMLTVGAFAVLVAALVLRDRFRGENRLLEPRV